MSYIVGKVGRKSVYYLEHKGNGQVGDEVKPQDGDRIIAPTPTILDDLREKGFSLSYGNKPAPSRGFADSGQGQEVVAQGTYRAPIIFKI